MTMIFDFRFSIFDLIFDLRLRVKSKIENRKSKMARGLV